MRDFEEMTGSCTANERDAIERILVVLDEKALNKMEKVIVLIGAIRQVVGKLPSS